MTAVVKSIGLALVGAALFFSFFMMLSIPVLMVVAKLNGNAPLQAPDVVLAPTAWFRAVGLPLAAVAFVACFVLAMKRSRKSSSQPSALSRQ